MPDSTEVTERAPWRLFDVAELRKEFEPGVVAYREFLRVPSLYCGLYQLPRGSQDMQNPHEDDEVYYVLEGRAQMRIGEGTAETVRPVEPGMLLHVRASEQHGFFEIEEDMLLLVMFATTLPGMEDSE